jgi:hypothetical protein
MKWTFSQRFIPFMVILIGLRPELQQLWPTMTLENLSTVKVKPWLSFSQQYNKTKQQAINSYNEHALKSDQSI